MMLNGLTPVLHRLAWVCGALMFLLCGPAQAHLLNMTKVVLMVEPGQQAQLTVSADLTRATNGGEFYYELSQREQPMQDGDIKTLTDDLLSALHITVDGASLNWRLTGIAFPTDTPREDFVSGLAWPMTRFSLAAELPELATGSSGIVRANFLSKFAFEEPIALSIQASDSGRSLNRWLVRNQQSPPFALNPTALSPVQTQQYQQENAGVWLSYLWQGVLHIVPKGWDHMLFVLGMFLGLTTIRNLIVWVTGFTLAHTLTLGLAAYGAVDISAGVIEPIIALSIAWVAMENLWHKPGLWWRLCVVFGFGLVHGLGFASVLKSLGLPADNLFAALISFNVGVELAQLGIIVVALLVVGRWRNTPYWRTRVVIPGSSVIALTALVLMGSRLLS